MTTSTAEIQKHLGLELKHSSHQLQCCLPCQKRMQVGDQQNKVGFMIQLM